MSQSNEDQLPAAVAALRDVLSRRLVVTIDRVQAAVDELVARGRMTREDAEDLLSSLVDIGRRQTQDVLADTLERVRRAAGLRPVFPISGYDDLTAAQIKGLLADLSADELRSVREHERRNANRKSVLTAVDRLLA